VRACTGPLKLALISGSRACQRRPSSWLRPALSCTALSCMAHVDSAETTAYMQCIGALSTRHCYRRRRFLLQADHTRTTSPKYCSCDAHRCPKPPSPPLGAPKKHVNSSTITLTRRSWRIPWPTRSHRLSISWRGLQRAQASSRAAKPRQSLEWGEATLARSQKSAAGRAALAAVTSRRFLLAPSPTLACQARQQ
jgi:hypothetical protein